ncbi:MAG: cyclic nucleotide-binding domain-containing protein [Alphaproteobacteria bacterium]|nr:cyclic nucleotide-binding domain-containing protein [Alphaproteobacteria bacterium]
MSLAEEVALLKSIPLFSKIEPSKLKLLAFTSERLAFDPDQQLFRQGDPGDAAYIVIDGEVSISIDAPNAPTGSIEVAKLGRGAIVGEIAILCDVPRTATVTARGKTVTLRISKDLFFRLIAEFPQIAVEVMRELAHRLENTNLQLREARAAKPH